MRWRVVTLVVACIVTQRGNVWASNEGPRPDGPPPPPPHRLELRPYGGWAFVPHSIVGAFVGADVTYRLHRRWALGGDVAWYSPFESPPPPSAANYPLNRTSWSADADVAFFPWTAHDGDGPGSGSFEAFVLLGTGLLASHPVAVVDPSRRFDDSVHITFAGAIGARLYVGPWLKVTLELRDLLYAEMHENPAVASGPGPGPSDPVTWYSASAALTQCVELRLGASVFPL